MSRTFQNPILPGFHPDPSVCRVNEDYYLVTSTFEYFPGVPIFHSRDLVHWQQIGHVLDRPSQLNLDGLPGSWGIYAPTIRYYKGIFYMITTLVTYVNGARGFRNFIVTTRDPEGAWSDPYWLPDAPGIDPSLLFDEDGRVWYTGNRIPPEGEKYVGHREIWLQELDLETMQLIGEKTALWDGAFKGASHPEAPHLYKINGYYYLMIAEGGTGHNHSVTIARSAAIKGPYESNPRNPILTHRHLGLHSQIACTGHADLVETQTGEWWMVALATRPYGGYYYNLGRETFLMPVVWEEGWPLVSPGTGKIEFSYTCPNLPEVLVPSLPACDGFEGEELAPVWNFLRTPREPCFSLRDRPGWLRLFLRPQRLAEAANPSFIGRRQEHIHFSARTVMEFEAKNDKECAGLALLQNENYQFRFVKSIWAGKNVLRLEKRVKGEESILAEQVIPSGKIYLKVEAFGQDYSFSFAHQPESWHDLARGIKGHILSTPVAGGFVGAYLGMYASSNGGFSNNFAEFDWFEYSGS